MVEGGATIALSAYPTERCDCSGVCEPVKGMEAVRAWRCGGAAEVSTMAGAGGSSVDRAQTWPGWVVCEAMEREKMRGLRII